MSQDTERKPRKPLLVNLFWCSAFMLLPTAYVLSYPLAFRVTPSEELWIYTPVEWLIDNTLLEEPMYRCSDCWGVGEEVRICSLIRQSSPMHALATD